MYDLVAPDDNGTLAWYKSAFNSLDADDSGFIEYDEFVNAALNS